MTLKKRLVIDIAMTILLAFEMFYSLTGDTLHEVVGFALFATIIVHLALSAKWAGGIVRSIRSKSANRKGIVHAVFAIVLLLAFIPLVTSSIVISRLLYAAGFKNLIWFSYGTWTVIHEALAYAVCVLTLIHLAMHWTSFASAWEIPYDPERRAAISTCVGIVAGIGAAALLAKGAKEIGLFSTSAESTSTETADAQGISTDEKVSSGSSGGSSGGSPSRLKGRKSGSNSSNEPDSSTSSSGSENSSSNSSTSGICTLCSKRCSLNSPKCDRPYREGLI